MGGNALKNTFTRRYQADEYHQLVDDIVSKSFPVFELMRMEVIPAYTEKESFGDMDILYSTFDGHSLTVDKIKSLFQPKEIVRNGEVISFDYKELQIDLIHAKDDYFDYALNYFSWNDAGNLIGKLAHRMGLKHGHLGLVLPLRDGDNKFDDVLITLDHGKTLGFLGLDVAQFNAGFNNLQEIFEFVAKSPHYSPESYKLENLNTIARVRDKKRDTYRKFLEFGESWTGPSATKVDDKSVYLEHIFRSFPDAYPQYQEAMQKLAMQKFVKEKFNGDLVSVWTGLVGKDLGLFMRHLRDDFYFAPETIVYLPADKIQINTVRKFLAWENAR